MTFPAETCTFLQKNAVSGGTSQEIAGGFQGSRVKNAGQLSQDHYLDHNIALLVLLSVGHLMKSVLTEAVPSISAISILHLNNFYCPMPGRLRAFPELRRQQLMEGGDRPRPWLTSPLQATCLKRHRTFGTTPGRFFTEVLGSSTFSE